MASVSSATSSLGNTSLRGFGGMASGIDRDSIIEQMTLGTNTKIANKKKEITSLEWKQEAYRDVIDKIIDMEDKYYTFSSSESLLNRSFFSKNQVSTLGDSGVTKYITATGNSNMLDYMSILGVKKMATAASQQSLSKGTSDFITTGITSANLNEEGATKTSNLAGKKLEFGNYNSSGQWVSQGSFTFQSTYEVMENGEKVTKTIDYTNLDTLEDELNKALASSNEQIAGEKISNVFEFKLDAAGNFQINYKDTAPESIKNNLRIRENSSALGTLGFDAGGDDFSKGISIYNFNTHSKDFANSSIQSNTLAEYMTGKKLSVSYGGQTKEITLITSDELKAIKAETDPDEAMKRLKDNIQSRLDSAFGKDNVKAVINGGTLEFGLKDSTTANGPTLTITNSSAAVRNTLGIQAGASNKISVDSSLYDNREKLGFGKDKTYSSAATLYNDYKTRYTQLEKKYNEWKDSLEEGKTPDQVDEADKPDYVKEFETLDRKLSDDLKKCMKDDKHFSDLTDADKQNLSNEYGALISSTSEEDKAKLEELEKAAFGEELQKMTINGVSGKDLNITANTTVNQFMNAINKNANIGVKATYLSSTNQFALIATETGSGRTIDLEEAANTIFGGTFKEGQNAEMAVSYGGIETVVESSTNTFNLEGMKVTVSGTFGSYEKAADGTIDSDSIDRTKAVTFSAKADVDAATERVKAFIEAYNALVSKVDKEMSTRPDSDYGPLTDEQKDEMDDTSIENWEKKAKEGLLFGDSNLRGLSDDLQTVIVSLINNGINTNDLESIGITMGGMYEEGGKLNFDEAKFRQAMEEDPDKVADIICGGGDVKTGLAETIGNKLGTYATRFSYKHNGSNGSLVEVAGTEKISSSLTKCQIYNQLKEMQEAIEKLKSALTVEQDRYIKQFTTMEQMISQMNSQSSYLSSLSAG